jgi:hypothetical protein
LDRDIILRQKMKKGEYGVVPRRDSWGLRDTRFFVENKTEFLFCVVSYFDRARNVVRDSELAPDHRVVEI